MRYRILIPEDRMEYLAAKTSGRIDADFEPSKLNYAQVKTSFFDYSTIPARLYFDEHDRSDSECSLSYFAVTLDADILLPRDPVFALKTLQALSTLTIHPTLDPKLAKRPLVREIDKILAIPGVGPVHAQRLLEQHGTFRGLMDFVRRGGDPGVASLARFCAPGN